MTRDCLNPVLIVLAVVAISLIGAIIVARL
jgi:hypothetical protein